MGIDQKHIRNPMVWQSTQISHHWSQSLVRRVPNWNLVAPWTRRLSPAPASYGRKETHPHPIPVGRQRLHIKRDNLHLIRANLRDRVPEQERKAWQVREHFESKEVWLRDKKAIKTRGVFRPVQNQQQRVINHKTGFRSNMSSKSTCDNFSS